MPQRSHHQKDWKNAVEQIQSKTHKTDEVRKTVMASMRNLAKLFIEFKKQLECVDETTEASLMFDRMNSASLSEAITNVTRRDNDATVKYEKHVQNAHELS